MVRTPTMIITPKLFHLHKNQTHSDFYQATGRFLSLSGLICFIVIAMHHDVLTNASQPVISGNLWRRSFAIRIGERLIIGIQPFATYPGRQVFAMC